MQYIWEVVLAAEKNGIRETISSTGRRKYGVPIWRFLFVI